MYQHFFGLRELPFELTANPRYLFMTGQHQEALSALEYGMMSVKAVTLLLGEVGSGKTTLVHAALQSDRCRHVSAVYINNPALTRQEFLEVLGERFHLSTEARVSKTRLLSELEQVLLQRRASGQVTALVIDEAQSMSDALLEEIRLLANTETEDAKLLPVVLSGQPEFADRLDETHLRQLKQRVTLRCTIGPLTVHESAAYIAQRIRVAGGNASELFTREAVILIHELAGGLPRLINVICDNSLLTACGLGRQPVDRQIVMEVADDFGFVPQNPAAPSVGGDKHPAVSVVGTAPPPMALASRPALTPDAQAASDVAPVAAPIATPDLTMAGTVTLAETPTPVRAEGLFASVAPPPRRFRLFR
jgi:general secretion pathway protein A